MLKTLIVSVRSLLVRTLLRTVLLGLIHSSRRFRKSTRDTESLPYNHFCNDVIRDPQVRDACLQTSVWPCIHSKIPILDVQLGLKANGYPGVQQAYIFYE